MLGIAPVSGRRFTASDYEPGNQYVALLTYAFWQREFGGTPAALGRALVLDDRPYRIVGILPPLPFDDITAPHDFWVPLLPRPGVAWEPMRGNGFIDVLASLAPGVTAASAEAGLSALASRMATTYPSSNAEKTAVRIRPLHDAIVAPVKPALLLILTAVLAVLLVACGNLVNLLLANAERRRHEFGVRLALGAETSRLRRQVAAEMLTIAGLAGVVSLFGAVARRRVPVDLPDAVPGAGALRLAPAIVWRRPRLVAPRRGAGVARCGGSANRPAPRRRLDRQPARTPGAGVARRGAGGVHDHAGVLGRGTRPQHGRLSNIGPGFSPHGVVAFSDQSVAGAEFEVRSRRAGS